MIFTYSIRVEAKNNEFFLNQEIRWTFWKQANDENFFKEPDSFIPICLLTVRFQNLSCVYREGALCGKQSQILRFNEAKLSTKDDNEVLTAPFWKNCFDSFHLFTFSKELFWYFS